MEVELHCENVEAVAGLHENKVCFVDTSGSDVLSTLVRRAPLKYAEEILVKSFARVGTFASFKRRWVELRGGSLIVCAEKAHREKVLQMEELQGAVVKQSVRSPEKLRISFRDAKRKHRVLELRFDSASRAGVWLEELDHLAGMRHAKLEDFEVISPIGKGGSGRVFLVRDKVTGEKLALKVLGKWDVMDNATATRHAVDERFVLEVAQGHPFILNLRYAFQSEQNLFLVCEFCSGGDVHTYLRNLPEHRMSEQDAKHMLAEVVLAMDFLHSSGVVYRDLKPENLLITADGHVAVGDFGLAKILPAGSFGRTRSFCGTREFLSPEVVKGSDYGVKVDSWGLGVLMYRLIAGYTPFFRPNQSRADLFRRIRYEELSFGSRFSADAVGLLEALLNKDDARRPTMMQVMGHAFFQDLDWDKVRRKEYEWYKGNPESPENFNLSKVRDLSLGESSAGSDWLISKISSGLELATGELRSSTTIDHNKIVGYAFTSSPAPSLSLGGLSDAS